jgi:hypothetical protein
VLVSILQFAHALTAFIYRKTQEFRYRRAGGGGQVHTGHRWRHALAWWLYSEFADAERRGVRAGGSVRNRNQRSTKGAGKSTQKDANPVYLLDCGDGSGHSFGARLWIRQRARKIACSLFWYGNTDLRPRRCHWKVALKGSHRGSLRRRDHRRFTPVHHVFHLVRFSLGDHSSSRTGDFTVVMASLSRRTRWEIADRKATGSAGGTAPHGIADHSSQIAGGRLQLQHRDLRLPLVFHFL